MLRKKTMKKFLPQPLSSFSTYCLMIYQKLQSKQNILRNNKIIQGVSKIVKQKVKFHSIKSNAFKNAFASFDHLTNTPHDQFQNKIMSVKEMECFSPKQLWVCLFHTLSFYETSNNSLTWFCALRLNKLTSTKFHQHYMCPFFV